MNDRDPGGGVVPGFPLRPTRRWRSLPFLVFGLMACATVATAVVVNDVVHDQERRLLEQRAQAASALVSTSFGGIGSTLPLLGAMSQPGLGSPGLFDAVAQRFVENGGTLGNATRIGDRFVVQTAVGDGPVEKSSLTGPRARLAERASKADGLVTSLPVGRREAPVDVRGPVADGPGASWCTPSSRLTRQRWRRARRMGRSASWRAPCTWATAPSAPTLLLATGPLPLSGEPITSRRMTSAPTSGYSS